MMSPLHHQVIITQFLQYNTHTHTTHYRTPEKSDLSPPQGEVKQPRWQKRLLKSISSEPRGEQSKSEKLEGARFLNFTTLTNTLANSLWNEGL